MCPPKEPWKALDLVSEFPRIEYILPSTPNALIEMNGKEQQICTQMNSYQKKKGGGGGYKHLFSNGGILLKA